MKASNLFKPTLPIAALRMMLAVIFFLHAGTRIAENSLSDLGSFLENKGFPFGFYIAWAITLFELLGSIALFLRYFVKLFCLGETIILITGIFLVHWQNSWLAAGMNLGSIEYSAVLITILIAVFIAESRASWIGKRSGK